MRVVLGAAEAEKRRSPTTVYSVCAHAFFRDLSDTAMQLTRLMSSSVICFTFCISPPSQLGSEATAIVQHVADIFPAYLKTIALELLADANCFSAKV